MFLVIFFSFSKTYFFYSVFIFSKFSGKCRKLKNDQIDQKDRKTD